MSKLLRHFSLSAVLVVALVPQLARATEVIDVPAPQAIVSENANGLHVRAGQVEFDIVDPAPGSDERAPFETIPQEDKIRFQKKRKAGLALVVKVLQSMKYGVGLGTIVKDRLGMRIDDVKDGWAKMKVNRIKDPNDQMMAQAHYELEREERFARQAELLKMTMKERAAVVIEGVVRNFDRNLWAQAPIFSHANEHAFYIGIGVGAVAKTLKMKGGALVDIGLSIGFNVEQKAVVFQIVRDVEAFQDSVFPAMVFGGVYVKSGYYFANQQPGHMRHDGTSIYPPALPGYTTTTSDVAVVGTNFGVPMLTFPPSPFDNALAYQNKTHMDAILRVTISPKTLGFIRIHLLPMKLIVEPVTDAIAAVRRVIFGRGGQCQAAFTAVAQ